jgi:hypothetical protein
MARSSREVRQLSISHSRIVNDNERRTAFTGEGIHDIVVWKEVEYNNSVVCMHPSELSCVEMDCGR